MKKIFFLIIIAAAAILLITVYNNAKHRTFAAEKINSDMVLNKKTKNEELKSNSFGKYPVQKLLYKITEDKNYKYIRVFKNGKETHISCIGG